MSTDDCVGCLLKLKVADVDTLSRTEMGSAPKLLYSWEANLMLCLTPSTCVSTLSTELAAV